MHKYRITIVIGTKKKFSLEEMKKLLRSKLKSFSFISIVEFSHEEK